MANYKNGGNGTNIIVWIITGLFLIVGVTFIVISCFDDMIEWFRTFGITMLVIGAVPAAWLLYKILDNKFRNM